MRGCGSHCPPLALTENDRKKRSREQRRKVGKQREMVTDLSGDKEREEIKPDHEAKYVIKEMPEESPSSRDDTAIGTPDMI